MGPRVVVVSFRVLRSSAGWCFRHEYNRGMYSSVKCVVSYVTFADIEGSKEIKVSPA